MKTTAALILPTVVLFLHAPFAYADTFGPSPYLCFDAATTSAIGDCGGADSPFTNLAFGFFYLEDFEDGVLDQPGISGDGSVLSLGDFQDGVDEDDGMIDGLSGATLTYGFPDDVGTTTFTFDASALGGSLPTHVGGVITNAFVHFSLEAFAADGGSLGLISSPATFVANGDTSDDRFLGISDPRGIKSVRFESGGGGLEVDHVQFGRLIPEPHTLGLLSVALLGLLYRSQAR